MLIESMVDEPFMYCWDGGKLCFRPGKPVLVSEERGRAILATCSDMVTSGVPCWEEEWWDSLHMIDSRTRDNHSWSCSIREALGQYDLAFYQGDYPAFLQAAHNVKIMIDKKKETL